MPKKLNVYIMGDIHGSVHPIKEFIRRNKDKQFNDTDILILLGDSGLNYHLDERDYFFKKALCKLPFTYFVIRGNHEERPSICMQNNPDKWEWSEFFSGSIFQEKEFPQIKYANDMPESYFIPKEDGTYYSTLVFPGAYSVDKFYRLMNKWNWFENEQLSPEEMDWGKGIIKFREEWDLVLSHTCPIIYEPTDLFLPTIDQSTVDKTMERFLGEIEYSTNYKAWLWGHYHKYRDYPRPDGRRRTMLFHEVIELNQYMNNDIVEIY